MKNVKVPLALLAHSRSGDKGSGSNIGVIAYTQSGYDFLKGYLLERKVERFFKALHPGKVKRYELPNLLAFNFVIEGILDGGGSRSLRIDAQGKALGQAILEMPVALPIEFFQMLTNKGVASTVFSNTQNSGSKNEQ